MVDSFAGQRRRKKWKNECLSRYDRAAPYEAGMRPLWFSAKNSRAQNSRFLLNLKKMKKEKPTWSDKLFFWFLVTDTTKIHQLPPDYTSFIQPDAMNAFSSSSILFLQYSFHRLCLCVLAMTTLIITSSTNKITCAIRLALPSKNSGIKNIPPNIKTFNSTVRRVCLRICWFIQ